jgi:ubiquitin-protein ligase
MRKEIAEYAYIEGLRSAMHGYARPSHYANVVTTLSENQDRRHHPHPAVSSPFAVHTHAAHLDGAGIRTSRDMHHPDWAGRMGMNMNAGGEQAHGVEEGVTDNRSFSNVSSTALGFETFERTCPRIPAPSGPVVSAARAGWGVDSFAGGGAHWVIHDQTTEALYQRIHNEQKPSSPRFSADESESECSTTTSSSTRMVLDSEDHHQTNHSASSHHSHAHDLETPLLLGSYHLSHRRAVATRSVEQPAYTYTLRLRDELQAIATRHIKYVVVSPACSVEQVQNATSVASTTAIIALRSWQVILRDIQWSGDFQKLTIRFRNGFPTNAPTVQFESPIFHPNVHESGAMNVENEWTPSSSIHMLLRRIQMLLRAPNMTLPASNDKAASLYDSSTTEYIERARAVSQCSYSASTREAMCDEIRNTLRRWISASSQMLRKRKRMEAEKSDGRGTKSKRERVFVTSGAV